MKRIFVVCLISSVCLFWLPDSFPHCQVPCGIYNDELRFTMIQEHILTIEKSMVQIIALSKEPSENYNQIVRWVLNKEKHADELAHTVTHYFLAQRIKPIDEEDSKPFRDYLFKVSLLHKMVVYSMKAKQTTDQANVDKLRSLLQDFRKVYLGKEKTVQSE